MKNGLWATGRRIALALAVAAAGSGLGGCVNQGEFDKLSDVNRTLTNRNQELTQDLEATRSENQILQRQRTANEQAVADLRRLNEDMQARLQGALGGLSDLQGRMGELGTIALDPETDRALQELASRYPNLIQYDAERGMLRFTSDLTFDSGQAVVKESARASLTALADVLKSNAALAYEVHVVGHTDAQRISAGTAQRHPTNMHLSAHRAIAVRDELARAGVTPEKMQAAGWGEFRPAVANGPRGEADQNRRVEIFLTRSTAGASVGSEAPASTTMVPDRSAPPERQFEPTK